LIAPHTPVVAEFFLTTKKPSLGILPNFWVILTHSRKVNIRLPSENIVKEFKFPSIKKKIAVLSVSVFCKLADFT
jgi:hypothetical protein